MAASVDSSSCVKCNKAIKSTEMVLVCGLWCRKSFHNDCLGLSNNEAHAVMRSKVRIKFHCETCEKRLGIELFRGKESHDPNKLDNCVNNCVNLLELVQYLVKVTNELSNSNSAINTKLDTVLSSNTRLEEYLLRPPKCFENRSEETRGSSLEDVEIASTKRITEIREQNDDTSSQNQRINSEQTECCVSQLQQTDNNCALCVASDVPKQLTGSQQQNVTEERSSNYLQEWEVPDGHDHTQGLLSVIKEECSPPEDFLMFNTFTTEKTEADEEEKSLIEDDVEGHSSSGDFPRPSIFKIEKTEDEDVVKVVSEDSIQGHSSSEDFLRPSTFNIEKTEDEDEDIVEFVSEDNLQELKHEVEMPVGGGEPESTIRVGVDDVKSNADNYGLVANISLAAGTSNLMQCTTTQEASSGNQFGTRHLGHRCGTSEKTFALLQEPKRHTHVDRRELLHSCSMCDKAFTSRGNLKRHFKVHTGERPYSCIICNKTFKQNSELKTHTRMHTGELPYMCEVCGKRFSRISNLNQHTRRHSWDTLFSCNICHNRFPNIRKLQRHRCIHMTKHPCT